MYRYLMWLCLFFVMGVLAVCPMAEEAVVYMVLSFGAVFLIYCLLKKRVILIPLLCIAFALGMWVMNEDSAKDYTYSRWADGKRIVQGRVVDSYLNGEYCISIVETDSVDYTKVKGKIKLYVLNGGELSYGDKIYAVGRFTVPEKPRKADEVDYRAYNFSRGIYANCFSYPDKIRVVEKGSSFNSESFGMYSRRAIKRSIARMLPKEEAGVLTALMLGDKSGVSDEFREIGSKAGIYHTMATSGLHVSLLLTFVGLFIDRIGRRKLTACINIALLLLIYVVIGYSPGISRAIIMSLLLCVSKLTDSCTDSYTSLALSAVIILVFSPYSLFDAGFLLSFASTLGILVVYQRFSKRIKGKILTTLAVSFAALLGTGALTAFYFGRLTLLGTVSNVFIVPLAGIILPIGYISVIMSMIWFPLGDFISYGVYPLIRLFILIAQVFARLPFASAEVPEPPGYLVLLITVGIFAFFAAIPAKGDKNEGRTIKKRAAKQSD